MDENIQYLPSTGKENRKITLYNSTIKEGNLKKIAGLLAKGANIDSQDLQGKTMLWWAAFNGNMELVQFLISQNANTTISDNLQRTPLDIATELALRGYREPGEGNKHAKIVELLKPFTISQTLPKPYQEDVDTITKKMSKLGIHAEKRKGLSTDHNVIFSEASGENKVCGKELPENQRSSSKIIKNEADLQQSEGCRLL